MGGVGDIELVTEKARPGFDDLIARRRGAEIEVKLFFEGFHFMSVSVMRRCND
jgi:hypothetical protein